jgi:hypothetical protein
MNIQATIYHCDQSAYKSDREKHQTAHPLTKNDAQPEEDEDSKSQTPPLHDVRCAPIEETLPLSTHDSSVFLDELRNILLLWQTSTDAAARGHIGSR